VDYLPNEEVIPHDAVPNRVNIVDQNSAIMVEGGGVNFCPNMPMGTTEPKGCENEARMEHLPRY